MSTITISVSLDFSSDANCEPCCAVGPSVVVTCESRTGTAELCGLSGYSADDAPYAAGDPEAWEGQYRKWRRRALDGTITVRTEKCAACWGGVTTDEFVQTLENSGTCEVTCEGVLSLGAWESKQWGFGSECGGGAPLVFTGTTSDALPGSFVTLVAPDCATPLPGESAGAAKVFVTKTLTVRTLTGCGCYVNSAGSEREATGSATGTLADEQTLYAALAADEAEPGAECCAETSAADLTTPESTTPITMSGTAVRLTITVRGAPSTAYLVTLSFANETTDEPPVVGDITTEEIEVTTDEEGDAVLEYDIPQPALGYRRCYLSANIAPNPPPES